MRTITITCDKCSKVLDPPNDASMRWYARTINDALGFDVMEADLCAEHDEELRNWVGNWRYRPEAHE